LPVDEQHRQDEPLLATVGDLRFARNELNFVREGAIVDEHPLGGGRGMRRQLALKKPHLKGDDIKEVQRKLGLRGDAVDGEFGEDTAFSVEQWKWKVGYPLDRINSTLGLPGLGLLLGDIKFPASMRQRAEERRGKPFLPSKKGIFLPLRPPVPRQSEFAFVEPEGAPDKNGVRHHAGLDWFAPTGTAVRAPVAGSIIEANPGGDTKGQVFGGTAKIEARDRKVWIFRHVAPKVRVGDRVTRGQLVATVHQWDDGPEHAHIEIRKTNAGGHVFENMLDPLPFFK
jgi:biotin carboxyl carrier protein